jgi:hypothetical protein
MMMLLVLCFVFWVSIPATTAAIDEKAQIPNVRNRVLSTIIEQEMNKTSFDSVAEPKSGV